MNSNDDDGSGRTRKRISRACDRCRVKKDRCDGSRPSCGACVATGQACTYEPSTKKRGLPEGYVRGLEKLWALSMEKIDGLEETLCQLLTTDRPMLKDIWNDESEDLHTKWKESSILSELESLLSGVESEPASTSSGTKRKRENDTQGDPDSATGWTPGQQPRYSIRPVDVSLDGSTSEVRLENAIESEKNLPPYTNKTLDRYFTFQHCWFPILERHKVLRTFYELSKSRQVSESDRAVLWALLAFTTQQYSNNYTIKSNASSSEVARDIEQMRQISRSLIPDERGPFMIGHVQTLLLLTLLDMGNGHWNRAWHLIGFASRIAMDLDLDSSNTSSEKRGPAVMQGCFMLDTLVANHLSRSPHLRRQNMTSLSNLEEDGGEEWEPWTMPGMDQNVEKEPAFIPSTFNRLRQIFVILNDIVAADAPTGEGRRYYFEERLKQLISHKNQIMEVSSSSSIPPHRIYSQMFYHAIEIVVVRLSFDERGAPSDLLAKLACDILNLFDQYVQQTPDMGLGNTPPVLEMIIRSACYAGIASKPSFGPDYGLPTYHDFAKRMTEYILQMSAVWPCFGSLANLWRSELSNTFSQLQIPTVHDHYVRQDQDLSLSTTDETGREQPPSTEEPIIEHTAFVEPTLPLTPPTQTSSSFPGDEVDVIFYNLAHLDTTEWTNTRDQGLRDFGFPDDMTFQAFCNDPERMVVPTHQLSQVLDQVWPPPGLYPGYFEAGQSDTVVPQNEISDQMLSQQERSTWWE